MREGHRATFWGLVALTVLAGLLFGAMRDVPLPGGVLRLEARHTVVAIALLLSGVLLLRARPEARPSRGWIAVLALFPIWTALQLVPLPRGVVAALSPERVELAELVATVPAMTCEGVLPRQVPAWLTLSTDPWGTFELLVYACALGMVFLASKTHFTNRRRSLQGFLIAITLFATFEAIYGLAQWLSDTPSILWYERVAYLDSATGTLINRNHFAQLMYLGIGASLALGNRLDTGRRRQGTEIEKTWALRLSLWLAISMQIAAAFASGSRAGIGGVVLVLAAAVISSTRRRRARGSGGRWAIVGTSLIAAITLVASAPTLIDRFAKLPNEWFGSGSRGEVLRTSVEIVGDFPAFGAGGGSFAHVWGLYRPPQIQGAYLFAHNDYLEVLTESGWIGLALVLLPLGFAGSILWRGSRRARDEPGSGPVRGLEPANTPLVAALVAALLHALVDFGLRVPSNGLLFALMAGAALALRASTHEETPSASPGAARLVAIVAIALSPLALAHSLSQWPGIGALVPSEPPEVLHARSGELYRDWRNQRKGDDERRLPFAPETADAAVAGAEGESTGSDAKSLFCESLGLQLEAWEARPLSQLYLVGYTTKAAAGREAGVLPVSEELGEGVAEAASVARTIDPWHARNRTRLLPISLAQGDMDAALADAEVIVRTENVSRRLVRSLLDYGFPPTIVGQLVESDALAYRELLRRVIDDEDDQMLRALIPRDVTASESRCFAGWQIRTALDRLYDEPGRRFLLECLDLPSSGKWSRDRRWAELWLARDAYFRGEYDVALEWIDGLEPSAATLRIQLDVARKLGEWEKVGTLGAKLLQNFRDGLSDYALGDTHWALAEARAREDKLAIALEELELALFYMPANPKIERQISQVRRGINPFTDP